MLINKISNKSEFQIYIMVYIILFIFGFLFAIMSISGLFTHNLIIINTLWVFIPFLIIFGLFESLIKPSYFETLINEKEIIIKFFRLNFKNGFLRNGLKPILLLGYRKHLKEIKLSQHEYNDYKLIIDKFGFRKVLILQKINKNGIYETFEINISLLGQKKYTNLILSIDRLKGKINLN